MISSQLTDPWERVRAGLRSAIFSGELRPGARLLETSLAEQFAVSRGPVREALRALEVEGLVVRERRLGSMVVPLDRRSAEELYSLRLLLEPFAARRALMQRPHPLLVRLSSALADMRATALESDRIRIVDPDIEFHTAFFREAEHERLLRVWETMTGPLKILIGMSSLRAPRASETSLLGHETIFAAASAGDVDACVGELEDHLETARALVTSDLPSSL